MSERTKLLVSQMTLKEKAALCMGEDMWHLKGIERLGLEPIMVTDGPHGVRKQVGATDNAGVFDSKPSTCFPTACTVASSWDMDLIFKMGEALAEESLQEKVSVLLGPGANIKRSPLCGRNFEYFSEDPFQSGEMAVAYVKGVQSKNVGTSLKHFVMNNQERLRMTIDSVVDERAQREIYLTGFEKCVKQAQPWTVMCAYNKVDQVYLSENKKLLTDVLRDQWGFEGLVMTDWGAANRADVGVKAGLDLEMPASGPKNTKAILNAVKADTLSSQELDTVVERVVDLILKSQDALVKEYKYDPQAHHELAGEIAGQSAVLLKNDSILPLKKDSDVAVIGKFAVKPRYQGAGSSLINPLKLENICSAMREKGYDFEYAQGYSAKTDEIDAAMIEAAAQAAKRHEYAIVFAGLTDAYESEGFDRTTLGIPHNQVALIKAVSEANSNLIIVLSNGSPVEMPWLPNAKAVLEAYLYGQAGAGAIVDILFGDICPSGKLAETFPLKLEDNSSYNYFPGHQCSVEYRESIYVGYRYYDKADKDVLFPFGYGLSYTDFEYSELKIEKDDGFNYTVSFIVKNIGNYDGAEAAQLYVKNNESPIFKAVKELKGFKKVFLKKGEQKSIILKLDKRSFAYYNVNIGDWHVDNGVYGVLVGSSSGDIRLKGQITIKVNDSVKVPDYRDALGCYYTLKDEVLNIDEKDFEKLLGRELPPRVRDADQSFDITSTLEDIRDTFIGKMLIKIIIKQLEKMIPEGTNPQEDSSYVMMTSMIKEMPLKSFGMVQGKGMPTYISDAVAAFANRKLLKGIWLMLKK